MTGLGVLFDETTRDSEEDFTRLDAIVLPIALVILGESSGMLALQWPLRLLADF